MNLDEDAELDRVLASADFTEDGAANVEPGLSGGSREGKEGSAEPPLLAGSHTFSRIHTGQQYYSSKKQLHKVRCVVHTHVSSLFPLPAR